MKAAVDIDHVGMPPCLEPDDPSRLVAGNIDRKGEPVADRLRPGRTIDQPDLLVQPAQRRIAEPGRAAADAQLHQARAGAHQDAEGARRDLGKERTLVAFANAVEFGAVIGDDPGEDIEPAGRALRVGGRRSAFAQRHIFEQRNDINAVLFENGAPRQVDAVHREEFELVAHARPRAGHKARPHPIGNLAEPQIDAGGLDLIVANRLWRQDLPALGHRVAQQL